MWDKLVRYLGMFPSAVLTSVDRAGHPFSLRCTPQPDGSRQVLRVQHTWGDSILPGPASLLCHSHDDHVWNLKAFQVFGHLEAGELEWGFVPERLVTGVGMGSPLDQMRWFFHCRAEAAKYLQKRSLARPQVPWGQIKALRKEASNR